MTIVIKNIAAKIIWLKENNVKLENIFISFGNPTALSKKLWTLPKTKHTLCCKCLGSFAF